MSTPLIITGYDTVRLDSVIDGSSELQLVHDSNPLSDHGQSLEAKHEDLSSPNGTVRIKLADFDHGGDGWDITASHVDDNNSTVAWSRGSDHAYYDFSATTDAVEVDVVATSDASSPATRVRKIWIKTKPVDAQPDRP